MMANGNSKRGITARSLPSRRTFRKLASATAGCVACRAELLERRMLLSGAPPSPDVLAGPVSSTDTAAWYHERVAVLQSLHLTEKAEPFDQIRRVGNAIPAQTATPQAPGLTPTQLKNYYDFTGLSFGSTPADGRGQTIALVDAFNDPDITGDLKTFDDAYGLAAPPSFKVVSQTGSTTALPGTDTPDPEYGSWATEESLDVEWAHALAPGANILLVECNSQSFSDLFAGVAYAASAPGVSVVSMSFGETEAAFTQSQVTAIDQTFTTPKGHQGVTFLASSGDEGAYSDYGPLAVLYPSSSPNVVSVGGTTIETNSSGTPVGESAWSGSGGGVSVLETQTAAQQAAVGTYSGRANPDVAFDADPNSGVNVCDSFDFPAATPFAVFGGTSFSSPAWAAILAITNQGRAAAGRATLDGQFQTIPDLYSAYTNGSYSSVFKDITTGANEFYSATKGYDLATGLGSPTVKALVPELVADVVQSTPPTIGSFTITPVAENPGTSVMLLASNVTDTAGNVTGVNFYSLNGTVRTLLGAGTVDASGNWTLSISTAGLSAGTYTYAAVATNNFKQNSRQVTATNQVATGQAPTIANFTVSPLTEPFGNNVELTATGVTDPTGQIASVAFYLQSGTSQTLLGDGTNTGAGKWELTASTLGLAPGLYTYVAIARAAGGLVSTPSTATNVVTLTTPITIVVNTTKDQTDAPGSKTVSLRDAVNIADAGGAAVMIDFDTKVFAKFQTIVLTGPTLSLTGATTSTVINGPEAGVAISGNGSREVLSIGPGANVSLSNLTITDGLSSGAGGGLNNAGNTTLTYVTVSHNVYSGFVGDGGGIENDGTLDLIDSVITGNISDNSYGGGIYNTGKLTAYQTTISDNFAFSGGGLGNAGTAALIDSTTSGNTAGRDGGGILNFDTLSLVGSTVSGNTAANGAGLFNMVGYDSPTSAIATITNSTVAKNSASYSYGGINNGTNCDLIVSDSTISQNAASYYGGVDNAGTAVIANTIIAGNTASPSETDSIDVAGSFTSQGNNLIGQTDGSTGWTASDFTGTNAKPLAADLSPLGNFGGLTQTMVPVTGSPALGRGSTLLIPGNVTTDQRGDERVIGGKVDIGSVEVQGGSTLNIEPPASQSAVAGKSTAFKLGSFSDPATSGPFTLVVDWGDGSVDSYASVKAAGSIPAQPHIFKIPGTFSASVVVVDGTGNSSNLGTFSIKVAPAAPVTITVNTTKDQTDPAGSKTVSLRDAVDMAGADYGHVTIQFDPKVFASHQTITLDGNYLEFSDPAGTLTINGPAAGLTISGNNKNIVLLVDNGVTAGISNLDIIDGNDNNSVGGISNYGTLTVLDSTVSGNTGGGIYNSGTLSMINSTVAGNTSQYGGAALFNDGQATLTNVTITANSDSAGSAIDNFSGNVVLANTIAAGNLMSGSLPENPDVAGSFSSQGHNLIGETDGSTGWIKSDLTGTLAKPLDPDLALLANNGGPTQTVLPKTGSPAIGAGSISLIPPGITTDERGKPRTIDGKVDIGAVEV